MNFDEINKISDYMVDKIYPHLQSPWEKVITNEIIMDKYLSIVDTDINYKILAVPYLLDPEKFLPPYKDKCIIFYNTPDPSDGLMLIVHQINPKFHVHSRLFCWIENNTVHAYITPLLFHKNGEEAIKFIRKHVESRKTGDTGERKNSGFKIPS